jgi:hypothetical protein
MRRTSNPNTAPEWVLRSYLRIHGALTTLRAAFMSDDIWAGLRLLGYRNWRPIQAPLRPRDQAAYDRALRKVTKTQKRKVIPASGHLGPEDLELGLVVPQPCESDPVLEQAWRRNSAV